MLTLSSTTRGYGLRPIGVRTAPGLVQASRYAARMALISVVVLASLVLMALAFMNRKR